MKKIKRMKYEDDYKTMNHKTTKKVRHHIINRCNGGHDSPENLLLIEEHKEKMIHFIFGNRDFYDIILFILRLCKMKHFEREKPEIKQLYKFLK